MTTPARTPARTGASGGPGTPRGRLALAGLLTAAAGLAVSQAIATALSLRVAPLVAVAEGVIKATPGAVAEAAISVVGTWDKPLLVTGVVVVLLALSAVAGVLAWRRLWASLLIFLVLGGVGAAAQLARPASGPYDVLPAALGCLTWLLVLPMLVESLRRRVALDAVPAEARPAARADRRSFLVRAGAVAGAALVLGVGGRLLGRERRGVERTRSLLRLPVRRGHVPAGAEVDVPGVEAWRSGNAGFYRIDTALVVPTVDPVRWRLRVRGMVDRELELSYSDLLDRELTQAWVTLCCVSNEVGGDLIGNAWWSGVRIADVLAEAGVSPDADAVLQTSEDGWTCGTPLAALTDDRNAMLAIAMNGAPLPVEHGFPVRMVVPGLFGYVSATKWLTDLEVTRFDRVDAYWTQRGWSERGPVRTQSRIDRPRNGDELPAGRRRVGGSAWAQHTGIAKVEYQLDGGRWQTAELGTVPSADTWVQWAGTVDLRPGSHTLVVRATDRSGYTQTSVRRDVVPNGATGWHTVEFDAN